jgi:hypothetical protein
LTRQARLLGTFDLADGLDLAFGPHEYYRGARATDCHMAPGPWEALTFGRVGVGPLHGIVVAQAQPADGILWVLQV